MFNGFVAFIQWAGKLQGVAGWMITLFGGIFGIWGFWGEYVQQFITYVGQIPAVQSYWPDFTVVSVTWWNKANTYCPLDVMFATTAIYITVLVACTVVRIIKSFVPTISG